METKRVISSGVTLVVPSTLVKVGRRMNEWKGRIDVSGGIQLKLHVALMPSVDQHVVSGLAGQIVRDGPTSYGGVTVHLRVTSVDVRGGCVESATDTIRPDRQHVYRWLRCSRHNGQWIGVDVQSSCKHDAWEEFKGCAGEIARSVAVVEA